MIHMHKRHPEMTDTDFSVIQENMENFLRVHQNKTEKGDYGGETVLCKIKTPRGIAGVSYEFLPTGRIFLKTAFFDHENGIDSWIAKNGTSRDLMDSGITKRGNAASMLTGHPSRTADAADSLTPSVAQPLSLFMIQERIGIVNGEKFNQSAWHGSPHDFDSFDLGAIGTGEGAQVHGWGLYFAQDRKVSEEYKEWLAGKHISYDGKPISAYTGDIHQALTALEKRIQPNFTEDIPTQIIAYRNELAQNVRRARVLLSAIDVELAKDEDSPPATLAALRKDASARIREIIDSAPPLRNGRRRKVADVMQYLRNEQERYRMFIRNAEVIVQQLQHIDSSKVGAGKGKLFEVEIPDNDVLLDEQKTMKEQPPKVQVGVHAILREMTGQEVSLTDGAVSEYTGKTLVNYLARTLKHKGSENPHKDASLLLNEHGIKGITYDGRRDGRCYVIFDDKAIQIIEKFNQQMNEIIKGTTQDVRDGQRIVSLFEEADESTFLHEMGHLFLLDLERLADMSPTSAQELQTVKKWAAWSEGQAEEYKGAPFAAEFAKLDADIRTALKKGDEKTANKLKRQWEHERFARGFEMYLKHGEAPTKGLRAVFAKFRAFLQRVYQAFTGTGGRATPEVEAVMARMIAMEEESIAENIERGKKAMQTVVATHQDVTNAMERSDVGAIDFVWGTPGKGAKFKQGKGIAHILAKHVPESGTQLLDKIVETIAKGEVIQEKTAGGSTQSRLVLEHNGYVALLSMNDDSGAWLLSGWETYDSMKKRASSASGEGDGSTVATATAPMRSRRDGEDALFSASNITSKEEEDNKKDSPSAEDFARSADKSNGARSTVGGNLSSVSTIAQEGAEGKQESTLENILQLAPALKKAALEYGANDERGKVTFADEERKQEFLKVAKALLSAGERKFSKAWHGSPHDFDGFDLGAIGTGEGAQTHGWGLYFAQNREVSEWYKDVLGEVQQAIIHAGDKKTYAMHPDGYRVERNSGKPLKEGSSIEIALSAFEDSNANVKQAIRETEEYLERMERIKDTDVRERNKDLIREALRILQEEADTWNLEKKKSSLFLVEIPDDDVLLDEQKKLVDQPKIVALLEKYAEKIGDWSFTLEEVPDYTGRDFYKYISDVEGGDKAASEYLNSAGIKGITYVGSRDGRCYVIFDDKAIKILEKFSARRQEALQEMLDGIRLIPPTRVSPRKRVLVDWGREMGVPVVFFEGDPSLHGFHQDGVTFLNVDSEITPQWTFWHEAMHWMKANNPDIYSDLVQEIRGAEGFTKKQLDAYRNEIGAPNMSDADVIEEMVADALPDARRRVPLLQDIGKRDTGLIQRLVAWIHDVMRRFHDHFYTPKGGLTSLQRQAMVRAFGNLARSIRDAEGKPIFRVGYEGARIILHDKSPLPDVKYSLDNGGREGDNEDKRSASIEARNQAITDSVTSLFRKEVDSLKESGLSEQEIARVLGDEHSDLRTRVLAPWLRQYNQFQAKYPDKRGIVNRIEGRDITDRSLSNEEISRRFDIFKTRMERMMDDAGLVYAECAYQRASRSSFVGFHSWQRVEQSIREHGGSAEFKERPTTRTKTSLSTKHLEQQGAFSTPKFSANTQEDRKGNFKWLTGAIRSFVGVAPADNLELPGRPTREVILSPQELERRIKERWIQEKNIISQEKQPDGKIKVTYYPDTHDVGYADWVKSVRQVAKRNPFVKILYDIAHKAMKKQEHLRNEFGKALKELGELVKNEEDLKTLAKILWLGDAKGKVFTDAELRAEGASENAIKAYRLVRRELEKAYKMLRDAQTQVKTYAREVAPESVEAFKKNHWIEDEDIISVTPHLNGKLLLTWRGCKTYDVHGKTMSAEALELMRQDENVSVTSAVPIGPHTFSVSYVERIKPVMRRTGYMPHFFHEWMIYEKIEDSWTGEVRYVSVGSGRTMNEAVKIGNEIAKDNEDKQYVLRPKGFDLGTENAVVVGDMDFAQMSQKLAESTEISLADARSLLLEDAGMSLKSRHRFFGSLLERKDGKGFDQDVQWVLAHYLNGAARYIAMEEFKPAAISMYERFFGAFDRKPPNLTAKYCQDLINDVNGNPRGVEVWLNDLIKKTWLGKHVADSYGDRVALAINGELSTWNAITKLGLLNVASAAVNFSQFINVGAALNDYGYAAKGLRRALNPSALDEKIIEASGLLDDINMADDNGGYTQRRGGKVRGIYSGVKKVGEKSLFLFQKADTLMRKAAVLGAYYQGIEQKEMKTAPGDELSAEALAYAQEINDDANFDYSAANAPGAFRAGSVVTQQLFQFQKYPIMQFEFMYNILKNGTRGQKVRMFVPYVLFCGMCGSIPFGGLFNQLFSFLFGLATGDDEDIAQEVKAEVLRWAGKDPVKKAIAETALYGILAPTFGLDISGRIGMSNAFAGEFYGEKPDSISGIVGQQLGGPMAVSAINMLRQAHEGNPIEVLKALSPALGNMVQAAVGVSRTTRHRVNARYDTAYDKIAHALGFRSVEESKNAFIMNYEYEQKSKLTRTKQEAIQDYLDDPSDANRRTINALGITERQIKEARIQQERTALERATEGRPNTSRKHGASQRRKEETKKETLYDTLDDE